MGRGAAPGRGPSGRRDPQAKTKEEREEEAPRAGAESHGEGSHGEGSRRRRPNAQGSLFSPEGKAAPRGGGSKASLKQKSEGAPQARGAAEPAEEPRDPRRPKQGSRPGVKEAGAGTAARRGCARQKAKDPRPAGEEGARAGGRGGRGGQEAEGGGRPSGEARQQEEEEEEGELAPRGGKKKGPPREGEGAAAKGGAPLRARPVLPEEEAAAAAAEGRGLRGETPILRQVMERLRLAREERSAAAQRVNALRDTLVAAVKKTPAFKAVEVFGAGSYYERVKICSPNEFDIMLKIPKLRVELEPCDAGTSAGAFYYVKLKRDPANKELKQFCDADERLSSSRMLSELRSIIIEELKKTGDMTVAVARKRPGCPAITLLIGSPPSVISVDIILGLEFHHPKWCAGTENGLGIEQWLGTKVKKSLHFEPLYLVPKNVKDGKCFIDNTWRISFSKIEKMLLNDHGQTKTCCEIKGVKCCRKDCLKLLKYLLEQLKTKHENRNQFDKFCSYQVKTAFFHACVRWPKDDDWITTNLDECFKRLLNYFLDCLKEANLPHFFIPKFNFFCEEQIERIKRNALVKAIERERNNGFPMFLN